MNQHAQDLAKQKEEEEAAFARIDWHDFMIVDTIEFTADDDAMDFPSGLSRIDLESRTLVEKKSSILVEEEVEAEEDDMDVEPAQKKIKM